MEKKSHIVSFDDARRSVRDSRVRSDAAARSSRDARGDMRGASSSGATRGSTRYARQQASSSLRGARNAQRERLSAHPASSRSGWQASRSSAYGSIEEEIDSIWSTSRRGHANAGLGNAAVGEEERAIDDERELDEQKRASFADRVSEKLAASKRARAKDKAQRRFTRQYGGSDTGKSSVDAAGPRAAVYKGEMGSKHKRAANMQNASERAHSARGVSAKKSRAFHPALMASAAVAACLLFGCVFLYGPAKTYYQEVRECDRLEAEYAALQQRNDAIQDEVDALSTDAGIENKARSEFGWVKEGENAVSVSGLDVEEESNFTANIVPGSVEAPDTWYSFLDPLFGVE